MESLGKSLHANGDKVQGHTGMIVWGGVGTNGQHAFHQWLFQGTSSLFVDFITVKTPAHTELLHRHRVLLANAIAQSEALMVGRPTEKTAHVHQTISGNTPSSFLVLDSLTPYSLGMLMALYEHKVYVQSVLWQIDAFDQWGVELGKHLVAAILDHHQPHDASTEQLIFKLLNF